MSTIPQDLTDGGEAKELAYLRSLSATEQQTIINFHFVRFGEALEEVALEQLGLSEYTTATQLPMEYFSYQVNTLMPSNLPTKYVEKVISQLPDLWSEGRAKMKLKNGAILNFVEAGFLLETFRTVWNEILTAETISA